MTSGTPSDNRSFSVQPERWHCLVAGPFLSPAGQRRCDCLLRAGCSSAAVAAGSRCS
jgi:hypothetical protein